MTGAVLALVCAVAQSGDRPPPPLPQPRPIPEQAPQPRLPVLSKEDAEVVKQLALLEQLELVENLDLFEDPADGGVERQ